VKAVADPFRRSTQGWLCHASASITLLFGLVALLPRAGRVCPEIGALMLLAADVQPESQPKSACKIQKRHAKQVACGSMTVL